MRQLEAIQQINLERTYHIVFSTYYRFPVLIQKQHQQAVTQWIKEICADKNIILEVYKVLSDHVHLLVTKRAGQLLPQLMQTIKGNTTYLFFHKFPEMQKEIGKTRLWNRSYNETLIQSELQLKNTIQYIENNFDKYHPGAPRFTPVGERSF